MKPHHGAARSNDWWGRANDLAIATLGALAFALGVLGTASMTWQYGPTGLLLTSVAPTLVMSAAVVGVLHYRASRMPDATAWSMFKTERAWRWLACAPMILLGTITVAATPFVVIAGLLVYLVLISSLLREAALAVRSVRSGRTPGADIAATRRRGSAARPTHSSPTGSRGHRRIAK